MAHASSKLFVFISDRKLFLSCSISPPRRQKIFSVSAAFYLTSDLVGSFESTVVSNVFSQSVSSIQRLLVDAVISVLLDHALGLLLEGLYRRVLPPGSQVSVLVIFSPWLY